MLGILASMGISPRLTKVVHSAKQFSVSKVTQITLDNSGYKN